MADAPVVPARPEDEATYPNWCRDGHEQIGYLEEPPDGEGDGCPLCIVLAKLAAVEAERDESRAHFRAADAELFEALKQERHYHARYDTVMADLQKVLAQCDQQAATIAALTKDLNQRTYELDRTRNERDRAERQVDRFALCPDHRDKATGRCVVCQAEERTRIELRRLDVDGRAFTSEAQP